MAYFFRKSIGVGPFRLNLSKSGIGGSVGFKGLRLTRTARGATYVTAGRAGVYYRETLSGTAVATQNQTPAVLPNPGVPSDGTSRLPDSLLLDSTCEKLLAQLNERARIKNPAGLFYAAAILGLLAAVFYGSETALLAPSAFPALVLAVTAAALGVMVRLRSDAKRCTTLMYTLDSAEQDKHASVVQAILDLAQCNRLWRVGAEASSASVPRLQISVRIGAPPCVTTNVQIPRLDMGVTQVYFLPDVILFLKYGRFSAVRYSDFRVEQYLITTVGYRDVPGDAIVVGKQWLHSRLDGGPDLRFNNNYQLPILQYGVLHFSCSTGALFRLNTSSGPRSLAFTECWRRVHPHRNDIPPPKGLATVAPGPREQALPTRG